MRLPCVVGLVVMVAVSGGCGDTEQEKPSTPTPESTTPGSAPASPSSSPAQTGDPCATYLARVCDVCGAQSTSCVNLRGTMESEKMKAQFTPAACTGRQMAFDTAIEKSAETKAGMCEKAPGAVPPELRL